MAWTSAIPSGLFPTEGCKGVRDRGLFFDCGSNNRMLVVRQSLYAELWGDPGLSTLGLLLTPGSAPRFGRRGGAGRRGPCNPFPCRATMAHYGRMPRWGCRL